uniref:Immunoglobulin domain-containing protein n=1 Tax=Cyprinus carpio TaxID=7962 RepID=A0A8C1LDB6_CYPCA
NDWFTLFMHINFCVSDPIPYESVSVMEGDTVTLNTDLPEIHEDDDILWKFVAENTLIAEISRDVGIFFTYNGPDERFRDRLKLDNQTGSLTITNITTQHAGDYEVKISGAKLTSKTFNVSVYGEYNSFVPAFTFLFIFKEYLGFSLFDCVGGLRFHKKKKKKKLKKKYKNIYKKDFLETISVMKGDSVTLNTDLPEIHEDDDILWNVVAEHILIAEINRDAGIFYKFNGTDERFRDRLKLDKQTGSLTITNITTQHAGNYEVKISGTGDNIRRSFETISVMEGDTVTLNTDLPEIHEDDDILWNVVAEHTLIAEINRDVGIFFTYNGPDERFRDRLKLDNQTGSLTITNITTKHAGDYEVKISGAKLTSKTFNVSVYGETFVTLDHKTNSVTLHHNLYVSNIQRDDEIEWRFEGTLIARVIVNNSEYYDEKTFKHRLKLGQTGSLTITNTRSADSGLYQLKTIIGNTESIKKINVIVNGE